MANTSTLTSNISERGNGTYVSSGKQPQIYIREGPIFDKVEEKFLEIYIFPFVFTVLYMVIGFIGNSIVAFIYCFRWKRNKTRIFIVSLALLDLCNCIFNMPIEAVILIKPLEFDFDMLCRISRFTTFLMNNSSCLVLVCIAIDRLLIVYKPLKNRAMTAVYAKIECILAVLASAMVSWPSLYLYGTYTIRIPLPMIADNIFVEGKMCYIADDRLDDKSWQLGFSVFLFILLITVFTVLIVLYVLIGRKIYLATRSEEERASASKVLGASIVSALTGSDVTHGHKTSSIPKLKLSKYPQKRSNSVSFDETSTLGSEAPVRRTSNVNTTFLRNSNSRRFSKVMGNATRRNTVMMRAVTICFMLSFSPYVVIVIIRYTNQNFYQGLNSIEKILYHVFLRTYFLNSVVNPFIYGFLNTEFRHKVKMLFRGMLCCLGRKIF